MITKTKDVFYCEHCKKHGLSKHAMTYHESICTKNPANKRPCFGCESLTQKEAAISGEYFNGSEWERKVELLYCKKKKVFLYPPKNEVKQNFFDTGDYINEPMPRECELRTETTLI